MGFRPGLTGATDGSIVVSWKFAAGATARRLASPWSPSLVIAAAFDAVTLQTINGLMLLVATVSGTTGATPPTSAQATEGTKFVDGTVTWKVYSLASVKSLQVVDDDASNAAKIGDADVQVTPVPANDGSVLSVAPNPSQTWVAAAAGTPSIVVVASS